MRRRAALLLGLLFLGGCTLTQSYSECSKDTDCKSPGKLFCTSDHLCVAGTPAEKLCTVHYPDKPAPRAVPIGVMLQLPDDDLLAKAVELAADEINMLSGSGVRPLVLHICDTAATEDDGVKAARILLRERNVVGIVGPSTSREVLAIASEVAAAQVPLVSPSATSTRISELTQGYTFRVVPSDDQQGPVLAKLATKPNAKLALLFINDAYGQGLQGAFLNAWMKTSMTMPVLTKSFSEDDAAQLKATEDAVLALSPAPDYVVAIAILSAPELVHRFFALPTSAQILMADGARNKEVLGVIDTLLKDGKPEADVKQYFGRIQGTAPTVTVSSAAFTNFRSLFKARFGSDPADAAFAAFGYDALYTIAVALGNAKGDVTGSAIAAGLRRIAGADMPVTVGAQYQEALNRMTAGRSVPLTGATGDIRFTDHGDRTGAVFEDWSIDPTARAFKSMPAN